MSLSYDNNIESIGGGFGGAGSNPLLWLITLGFLKGNDGLFGGGNGEAGAGVLAGANQAKLDCLAQGQNALSSKIENAEQAERFSNIRNQIDILSGISRDSTSALTSQINDLRAQAAECCCENRVGQQEIKTAIVMQTNDLVAAGTANTQRIVDLLTSQTVEAKNQRISELERQSQTSLLINTINQACGSASNCNGGGNTIDINVLAAALARGNGVGNQSVGN